MIKELKQLQIAKLKVAALEKSIALKNQKELPKLPAKFGFKTTKEFVQAVLAANTKPKAVKAVKSKAKKVKAVKPKKTAKKAKKAKRKVKAK